MILAAGFGTRLWPLTIGRTKPALPFLNRPLISYAIDYVKRNEIDDLIINLHHEPASVQQQIGDGSNYGVRITYSIEEPEILGPAGALDQVRDLLTEDTFVVVNGKIITDIDLKAAIASHRARKAMATLVLRPNPLHERFSEVEITPDGRISRFAGFPSPQTAGTRPAPLMFTGIHILDPAIFKYIARGVFSDTVRDVYPAAMAAGELIAAYVAEGDWYEVSTLERYLSVSLGFLAREGHSYVIDEGTEIEPGALVERSVIWKNVRVARGAEVIECIVGDGVTIPAGESYRRAVIVRAELAAGSERPEKALSGEIRGANLVVPL
jgi:NDP-sugar pyrophosphorylase family protein